MKVSTSYFLRFEKNFGSNGKLIAYDIINGKIFELSSIYHEYIECFKTNCDFTEYLIEKYNLDKKTAQESCEKIVFNLKKMGVICD
ncbi:MAG: hypothetical protein FWH31_06955 [Streptococcaceae bacterium]|nr:hypothetical protein [Streptococcaceae bacterium]